MSNLRGAKRRGFGLVTTLLLLFLIRGDANVFHDSLSRMAHASSSPTSAAPPTPTTSQTPSIESNPKQIQRVFCPEGMVLVEGNYCPKVRHHCIHWLDDSKLPYARCGRYAQQAECLVRRTPLRFCIDRVELTRPGETVPENFLSLNLAAKRCRFINKRVCQEQEWNFACEGEEMRPYPYGWSREAKCHQDRTDLFEMREQKQYLRDLRARSEDFQACVSPFGVLNLVGNLDEPVIPEGVVFPTLRTALKGGWWMPGRNRCRPATTAHDADYRGVQIGARCCADIADER